MLHNKYFDIIKQFLGEYNKEIYGRELINKVNMSQKGIALALDELEQKNILKSKIRGNMKYFSLNIENPEIKDILLITEIEKKKLFFEKHRKIAHLFRFDERIVGIFGSYAKGIHKETSDIDLFIIGKKIKKDYDEIGKTFDLNISIKYFTEKQFEQLSSEKNNLCKEIIANHICIFQAENFINIIWRKFYGFN